ncbi:hypothetical protein D3C87_183990 [compost metagenome]
MTKDQIKGKVFTSGPLAMTDIHNGGSIFGIIFSQYLEFISDNEVNITNKVTFNRGMQDWQDSKEKEYWKGFYEIDRDDKHIRCELTYENKKIVLYADFIDDDTLLCEEYFNCEDNGQGRVFSRV